MSLLPRPLTELQAVNELLASIDAMPVNTLTDVVGTDAGLALSFIRSVTRDVQTEGWHFNTEDNYLLQPTVDGEIYLPVNCIRADLDEGGGYDVVMRGRRLYDKVSHSYKFDSSVTATLVLLLPFDETPEAARMYITVRAMRLFQDKVITDPDMHTFSQQDEYRSKAIFMGEQLDNADYNVLSGEARKYGYKHNGFNIARALKRTV